MRKSQDVSQFSKQLSWHLAFRKKRGYPFAANLQNARHNGPFLRFAAAARVANGVIIRANQPVCLQSRRKWRAVGKNFTYGRGISFFDTTVFCVYWTNTTGWRQLFNYRLLLPPFLIDSSFESIFKMHLNFSNAKIGCSICGRCVGWKKFRNGKCVLYSRLLLFWANVELNYSVGWTCFILWYE